MPRVQRAPCGAGTCTQPSTAPAPRSALALSAPSPQARRSMCELAGEGREVRKARTEGGKLFTFAYFVAKSWVSWIGFAFLILAVAILKASYLPLCM